MSFLQVGLVGQPRFAATDLAVHSMFARAGMFAQIEGAEQSPTGLGLAESVAQVMSAISGQNAFKTDALSLTFLLVESAVLMMFVRADTSAPIMEDANLVVHAALGMVECVMWEMPVRVERNASGTDVLPLSFLPVVSADSEIFAQPDISVSMVGAM
jgi:hypothetical protein